VWLLTLMQLGGVAIIVLGLLLILFYSSLEFIGPIYLVFGGLLVFGGAYWILRVRSAERKVKAREVLKRQRSTMYTAALAALVTVALTTSVVALAQTTMTEVVQYCLTMYRRVMFMQYFIIGLLLIAGLLSFAPIIFGRTILGPILQELQYIAGAMFIILVFVALLLFPLDPMFTGIEQGTCKINFENLKNNGPPLLKLILNFFSPPQNPPS